MQHHKHGQQLPQQQQHLAATEHKLTLGAGRQKVGIGAAALPVADQPPIGTVLDQAPEPGHLGMEQGLQASRQSQQLLLAMTGGQLTQDHRRLIGEQINAPPQGALGPIRQTQLEAVSLRQHLTGNGGSGHQRRACARGRWG